MDTLGDVSTTDPTRSRKLSSEIICPKLGKSTQNWGHMAAENSAIKSLQMQISNKHFFNRTTDEQRENKKPGEN
ncbi:hypothetical protein NQU17_12975 [Clostridiaceae bacterium HFYG-1003]|nr:hypothetical protein NQU17_12975 [Clostridiaceae bacterium HFYG-1003]